MGQDKRASAHRARVRQRSSELNAKFRNARESTPSRTTPGFSMSRAELADAVNEYLWRTTKKNYTSLDARAIGRYERGEVQWPTSVYRTALREILGASTDADLGFVPVVREGSTARVPIAPRSRPGNASSAVPAACLDIVDVQPDRLLGHLSMFAADVPRARVDSSSMAAVRAMSDSIQIADRRLGGGRLYQTVTQYLRYEIAPYFLDPPGDCSPSELFVAAASLTEIAGWMAHDGGNNERARAHFANAFRLARAGRNVALSANVCASMAHLALQLDFPEDAVRISGTGLKLSDELFGANGLVARLHTMRARAHAVSGRDGECRTDLESAHASLAAESGADIEWIASFDEASLASESALCFLDLGSLGDAEKESRKVIHLRVGDRVRSRALGQLTLASVLVKDGAYDEAARIGLEICDVARDLNSARVHSGLSKLGEYLAAHAAVADVAEFLTAEAEVSWSRRSA